MDLYVGASIEGCPYNVWLNFAIFFSKNRKILNERQLGHPVPAGHHELDEPGIDADMLVPLQGQHVWAV